MQPEHSYTTRSEFNCKYTHPPPLPYTEQFVLFRPLFLDVYSA